MCLSMSQQALPHRASCVYRSGRGILGLLEVSPQDVACGLGSVLVTTLLAAVRSYLTNVT